MSKCAIQQAVLLRLVAGYAPGAATPEIAARLDRDVANTRKTLVALVGEGLLSFDRPLYTITDLGRAELGKVSEIEGAAPAGDPSSITLPYDRFYPDPDQPRDDFDQDAQMALNHSVRDKGMLQRILVHPADPDGRHKIIAGERRWRAAVWGNVDVSAVVRVVGEGGELLDLQLAENAQRLGLNPMEDARAFQRRMASGGRTEEIARTVGKTQRYVQERLQLLAADPATQAAVAAGELGVEAAIDRIREANAEAAKSAPLTPKLLLAFAECADAILSSGMTSAPILHMPGQGAGLELERRELLRFPEVDGGPHVMFTAPGRERLTALCPGVQLEENRRPWLAEARAAVLSKSALAELADAYATPWLNVPKTTAPTAPPKPPPVTNNDDQDEAAKAYARVAKIKLSREEAVALAELADKVARTGHANLPGKTAIVDDSTPRLERTGLSAAELIVVWDAAEGLVAGLTPDGYAWLAANHVGGAALTGGAYLTDWLNTSTEIAPRPAADRGTPAREMPTPPASSEADAAREAWREAKRAEIVAWFVKAKPKQILVLAEIAHKALRWPTSADGDRPETFTTDRELADPMAQTIVNLGGFFASGGGKPNRVGIHVAFLAELYARGFYAPDIIAGDQALRECQIYALGDKAAAKLFVDDAYATPWLNTQGHPRTLPASPADYPPAGAASPAVEPRAGEEPGPPRPLMDTSAPGSTPSEDEPYDPNGWARRLLDKAAIGDTAGVYMAVTALMRISGSPEVSGEALRRAKFYADRLGEDPVDALYAAGEKAREFLCWNYVETSKLDGAEATYLALANALNAAKASAARLARIGEG